MDVSAYNTSNESEIDVRTFSKLKLNGVTFESKFESDVLKIPAIFPSVFQCGSYPKIKNKPYYLKIPKDVILNMLKEYLPELKEEIKTIVFSDFQRKEEMSPTDPRRVETVPLFFSDM